MAKAARKTKPEAPGDFTDRLRAASTFGDARVELLPGERRAALNTRRRRSKASIWLQHHWVGEREAAALMRYELLIDACNYESTRSCCDNSVRGGGGGMPPAVVRARHDRAIAANAVEHQVWLMGVVGMMSDEGDPDECRQRLFGGSREFAEGEARRAVLGVAGDLARHFGA